MVSQIGRLEKAVETGRSVLLSADDAVQVLMALRMAQEYADTLEAQVDAIRKIIAAN